MIDILENYYNFSNVEILNEQHNGTRSKIKFIKVNSNKYVVKIFETIDDVTREANISSNKLLTAVPNVLENTDFKFITKDSNNDYIVVQEFLSGESIKRNSLEDIILIATSISNFINNINTTTPFKPAVNQFDLMKLYNKINSTAIYNILDSHNMSKQRIHTLKEYEDNQIQDLIHGDLGIWNMIKVNDEVKIYDFGEARYGSLYFDLAAALVTAIDIFSTTPSLLDDLVNTFINNLKIEGLNFSDLRVFIEIWMIKGLLIHLSIIKTRPQTIIEHEVFKTSEEIQRILNVLNFLTV